MKNLLSWKKILKRCVYSFSLFFVLGVCPLWAGSILQSVVPQNLQIVTQKDLKLSAVLQPQIKKLWINGKQMNANKDLAVFVSFEKYGKQLIKLSAETLNGEKISEELKYQYLPSQEDAAYFSAIFEKISSPVNFGDLARVVIYFQTNDQLPAETALLKAYNKGLIAESRLPGKNINRFELMQALINLSGTAVDPKVEGVVFADVDKSSPLAATLQAAKKMGLTDKLNLTGNQFVPTAKVTAKELWETIALIPEGQRLLNELKSWDKQFEEGVVQVPAVSIKNNLSLDFNQISLANLIEVFKKETGLNIVAPKDLNTMVSVHLNGVEPMAALKSVLSNAGYGLVAREDYFEVMSLSQVQKLELTPRVKSYTINYIPLDELTGQVVKLIPSLQGKMIVGKGSQTLVVQASASEISRLDQLIDSLDVAPLQVFVEAEIMELSVNDKDKWGISYQNPGDNTSGIVNGQYSGLSPINNNSKGMFVKVLDGTVQAYLNALKQKDADFDLLSSPRLMVLSGQEGVLHAGQKLGYQLIDLINTSSGSTAIKKIEFLELGTKLRIVPRIGRDGLVQMEIYPEVSDGEIDVAGVPQQRITKASSQIIVRDGQTFIIGGLIFDKLILSENKVPLLGDMPLIGNLFKSRETSTVKKDLVVMITPHIMDPTRPYMQAPEIQKQKDLHDAYREKLSDLNK